MYHEIWSGELNCMVFVCTMKSGLENSFESLCVYHEIWSGELNCMVFVCVYHELWSGELISESLC